jgi:poly(beta-D-mannuronate) lyase
MIHLCDRLLFVRTSPVLRVFLFGLALPATVHAADKLLSPWDSIQTIQTDKPYNCPAPPTFSTTLNVSAYYIDKNASIIDSERLDAWNTASEGPTHLGQFATRAADAYLATGSRAAARCVYTLLDAAAQAAAWTDRMPDFNGVYLQDWLLSGVAIAYLKLRPGNLSTSQQDAEIRRWFRLLSIRVREFFDDEATRLGPGNENNHLYWAGLAVAAEGIVDNNPQATQWGANAYSNGIDVIQSDGSLSKEMARAGRALHYHLYALGPLIMIAELLEANGAPAYAWDLNPPKQPANPQGAIHRLVALSLAGLEDPTLIQKRTGVPQVFTLPYEGMDIGWAVPYVRRFPNSPSTPQLRALIAKAPWVNFWQWGGAPPP